MDFSPLQWLTDMSKLLALLNGLFVLPYNLLSSDQPLRRCRHHAQGLGWVMPFLLTKNIDNGVAGKKFIIEIKE